MNPAGTFGASTSVPEAPEGCADLCGMCPPCAFAPTPPASTRCLWKVSDNFKRRFVLELLLRCRNPRVLEGIHGVLTAATSGTLFTYARSRSPTSPRDFPRRRGADRPPDEKPAGLDVKGIWRWFNGSPHWVQSRYLCRLFTLCDCELLRMVANLTSVLLVRQKRGFLQIKASCGNTIRHDETSDEDSEDPALMVMPGSSKSVSGVSRHRDFIGCLPVDLSKRVLGLLDENTLRSCLKVSQCWMLLADETLEDIKFRRVFQKENKAIIKKYKSVKKVDPTYAKVVDVPVPVAKDEKEDVHAEVQKVKLFKAAYANIKTKSVQMEERNVYCGAYFTTVLLDKPDAHRVVDYRGGALMATGSKDRVARLFHVASQTTARAALSGHTGAIRAVLLCEERGLLVTAGRDASIRCWSLKTDVCEMQLQGHTGSINCLHVHGDRLASGAKDCKVKVWSLQTGTDFEAFGFQHPSSVQCVRITASRVFSGCSRGLVRVWDMETASLLREINAHQASVKCLFVDERHFLSADAGGKVAAWSVSCDAKDCLVTFKHPKQVNSLTLLYLRVITGCVDGKIRIFNFLTGVCLRDIAAEAEAGRLLSLHLHDDRIIVNSRSGVKLYQFAKVFWDYAEDRSASAPETKRQESSRKPERAEPLHRTRFLSVPQERRETPKRALALSEKAASERVRRRGLHHPLTRDSMLLRVNAVQKALCMDEAGVNMERNAALRDAWGDAKPPARAKTCVPILKRSDRGHGGKAIRGRDVCTAPADAARRPLPDPGRAAKMGARLPRINPAGPRLLDQKLSEWKKKRGKTS